MASKSGPGGYISNSTLKATQQTMNVISTVLHFDVVELWKFENGQYTPVFIHAEDSVRKLNTSIIASDAFYPNDGRKHVLSPMLCDQARQSPNGYTWRVADPANVGKNGKPVLFPDHPTPYQTAMSYHVNADKPGISITILGFSLSTVPFTNSRFNFLSGVSYAIYIAAFDLDEEDDVVKDASQLASDALKRKELDTVSVPLMSSLALSLEDSSRPYLYPVSDISQKKDIPCINFNDIHNVRHIADGSNSNVYVGTLYGQQVVVKMITEDTASDPVVNHEYDVETALLVRFNHPNIVNILGYGTFPRRFLVLEWLGGGILGAILEANEIKSGEIRMLHKPTFTYDLLLANAKELASALHYLHHGVHDGATIIHRDLKPDNIGFTEDGTLKILDFGLCTCIKSRKRADVFYEMTGHTGSLRYMAPEVAQHKPYGEKVDVHSFGIILWQMAKDKVPFDGMDAEEFTTSVVQNKERPKLDKSWPPEFTNLLVSCWNPNPVSRPSFREIVITLEGLLGTTGGSSQSVSKKSSSWF
jgi:tRNA A-37 threonylcarbamoyl transferase component Bud32